MNFRIVRILQLLACTAAIVTIYASTFDGIQGVVLVSIPYIVFFTTIKASDPTDIIRLGAAVLFVLVVISAIIAFGIQSDAQASIGVSLLLILQYLIAIVFFVAYWRGNGQLGDKSA
jgi:hypothetical protein